jgi:hypothetical protein
LVAGVVSQVDKIRHQLAWDAVEYGMEIQIWGSAPLSVFWNDQGYSGGYDIKAELPLTLPRYSLVTGEDYDDLITTIVRDLFNACGNICNTVCKVPWTELENRQIQ